MCDDATLRGSCYEIDLEAIRHNYRQLRAQLGGHVKVYACLKRNGYGCGAGPVAAALASEGAYGFAVASLMDAIAIRREGVSHPLLLYPGPGIAAARTIEALGLTVSISSIDELRQWRSVIGSLSVFIKVDLGFFRAGATPLSVCDLLAAAEDDQRVRVEGIYAHMSELPPAGSQMAQAQYGRMRAVVMHAERLGLRPPLVMMSSTNGVLNHPEMDFDAVDPGALFFGVAEGSLGSRSMPLQPALKTVRTRLVSVKRVDRSLGTVPEIAGLRRGMLLGVIGMGWGDGLPRQLPPNVTALVRGRRARLLPPSHLEHIRIDLSDVPDARFGDEVVLLGKQAHQTITHEEIASQWGTDVVGLYGLLRDHIPKIYL
nr:alanine racemase [Rhizobium wenxiniae]